MERERWLKVYRVFVRLDQDPFRGVFVASAILGVFFWAVVHDRPICWACQRRNWPAGLWRTALPSQSTMSRRLKTAAVQALLAAAGRDPAICGEPLLDWVKVVDGKPLPVGGYTKDPDVCGWAYGLRTLQKGYKLFTVWGRGPMPITWRVEALVKSEQAVAERMFADLQGSGGYLLGDKLYDINKLYEAACHVGHQLVAERKRPKAGLGTRRQSPARLRALALLKTDYGQTLYQQRDEIERKYSGLTNFGGGLAPLPNWVRRRSRVVLWVHAKLIINSVRQLERPIAVA